MQTYSASRTLPVVSVIRSQLVLAKLDRTCTGGISVGSQHLDSDAREEERTYLDMLFLVWN